MSDEAAENIMVNQEKNIIGWREWIALPELGIPGIKAKVDTGAKTSCLHAFEVAVRSTAAGDLVDFKLHPLRKRRDIIISCTAPLVDTRSVRDSGGHTEERLVVSSRLKVGPVDMVTEFTLTSRDDMIFPMLLGRRAIQAGNLLVDVNQSYVFGRIKPGKYQTLLAEGNR